MRLLRLEGLFFTHNGFLHSIIKNATIKRFWYAKSSLFRLVCKPYSVENAHLSGQDVTELLLRSTRKSNEPSQLSFLFDLAPDGGYLAGLVTKPAGGLLHHLFNLTYCNAVCFCGPNPKAYASPGVTWHPALWCTDFPHSAKSAHIQPT